MTVDLRSTHPDLEGSFRTGHRWHCSTTSPQTMSSKAQMLLGVSSRDYDRMTRSPLRTSYQASVYEEPVPDNVNTGDNLRPPPRARASLRSTDSGSVRCDSHHPTFSIVPNTGVTSQGPPQQKTSKNGLNLLRRNSNSTLRSFAPPTIPTYLPRHTTGDYTPHVGYGKATPPPGPTNREDGRSSRAANPISSPTSPTEPKHGLRKALSRLSLRPTKSRSRLSEVSSPKTSAPELSHQIYKPQGAASPQLTSFSSRPKLSAKEAGYRSEEVTSLKPEENRKQNMGTPKAQLPPRRKEWFDRLDEDNEEDHERADSREPSPHFVRQRMPGSPRSIAATGAGLIPRSRVRSSRSSLQQAQPPEDVDSPSEFQDVQPQTPILFEQTMFSFDDSDDENEIQSKPTSSRNSGVVQRHRKSASRELVVSRPMSALNRSRIHKRSRSGRFIAAQRSSTFFDMEPPEQANDKSRPPSLAPHEEMLTESLPSLIGSGSSRPTSWFSSHPNSPHPLLVGKPMQGVYTDDQDVSFPPDADYLPERIMRRSGSAIVSQLKLASSANRIVAAISPEEAILLAKIRRNRNRTDTLSRLSEPPSESSTRPKDESEKHVPPRSILKKRESRFSSQAPSRSSAASEMDFTKTNSPSRLPISASTTERKPCPSSIKVPVKRQSTIGESRRSRVMSQLLAAPISETPIETSIGSFPRPPSSLRRETSNKSRVATGQATCAGEVKVQQMPDPPAGGHTAFDSASSDPPSAASTTQEGGTAGMRAPEQPNDVADAHQTSPTDDPTSAAYTAYESESPELSEAEHAEGTGDMAQMKHAGDSTPPAYTVYDSDSPEPPPVEVTEEANELPAGSPPSDDQNDYIDDVMDAWRALGG